MQEILNYTFKDKSLLETALTHRSQGENCNERLEFLGDSVLSLVVADYLFANFKNCDEGLLTTMRAYLVREESLVECAKLIKLNKRMNVAKNEFKNGKIMPSVLADAMEAIFGAIFLDGGLTCAKEAILSLLQDRIAGIDTAMLKDPKTTLKEHLSKQGNENIVYKTVRETGPAHDKTFYVHLFIAGKKISSGKGKTKKDAQQGAAKAALKILKIK